MSNLRKSQSTNAVTRIAIQKYILECIDLEEYDETLININAQGIEKYTELKKAFDSEYSDPFTMKKYPSDRDRFEQWCKGLPNVFNIAFHFHEILPILNGWNVSTAKTKADEVDYHKNYEIFLNLISREFFNVLNRGKFSIIKKPQNKLFPISTQKQLRQMFWDAHPQFKDEFRKTKRQNHYNADIRMAWCDYVDYMQKDGQISENLSNRATL